MKNRACCWILVLLGAGIILSGILSVVLISSLASLGNQKATIEPGSYLMVDLSGATAEYRTAPSIEIWQRRTTTLADYLESLKIAAVDPRISGVVIRPTGSAGFAGLRELREAVLTFKESGKPVYAYMEVGTDRDYYLSSVADTIIVSPATSGGLVMLGLGVSSTYLARTFDKVGIKFHVLHVGEYKGAYENLQLDKMSAPLRESLVALLDDVFGTYVRETAESRTQIERAFFEKTLLEPQELFITGSRAVELGLADLALDWGELRERIKVGDDFNGISPDRLIKTRTILKTGNEIAVLFAQGVISYGEEADDPTEIGEGIHSRDVIAQLRDLREDPDVKAVVLRVNSPGGSALASELILEEVKRLKSEKPVVVSMGNVAASGGYYISCAGNRIIAQPNTITGSIGVVSVLPNAEGLFDKIGARVETVEKGKWAQFFRIDKEFTPEQEAVMMGFMNNVYQGFVANVADGRGLPIDSVEMAASGRVWTGAQALKLRLVDELGGLDLAIDRAAELADLERSSAAIRHYPRERDLISYLLQMMRTTAQLVTGHLFFPENELDLQHAAEYLNRFLKNRDYVQMILPIELP
ncbi:MAG: signal peptide peptidase SppA [Calditrichota bacterium]